MVQEQTLKEISRVVAVVLENDNARSATLFVDPKIVLRVTRRIYRRNGKPHPRAIELSVSLTRPNYAERQLIKKCGGKKNAGFPIGTVHVRYLKSKKRGRK